MKYGIDNIFFIVEQKSLNDVFGELKSVGNGLKRDKKPSTIREMQKMIKNCDCSKFWIVNKYTDDIYGPYTWDEYIQKRKELGVSKKLVLKTNENIRGIN